MFILCGYVESSIARGDIRSVFSSSSETLRLKFISVVFDAGKMSVINGDELNLRIVLCWLLCLGGVSRQGRSGSCVCQCCADGQ